MSDLTWADKLNHIRFSRSILLVEKWFSVLILCWLLLFTNNYPIVAFAALLFLFLFLLNHINHRQLEHAGGMPTSELVVRY